MVHNAPTQSPASQSIGSELASLYDQGDALISKLRDERKPRVFIISGPSGVGKDTVIEQLRAVYPDAAYVVTATTRPMRAGEIDGVHYRFMSKDDFLDGLGENDFIENAMVYDNHYGVPRSPIVDGMAAGRHVIIKVDVTGAATLRELITNTISIFLAPESMPELLDRLRSRKTDDPDVLMKRFRTASHELERAAEFDYVVFNEAGKLNDALHQICHIIDTEQRRVHQPDIELPD